MNLIPKGKGLHSVLSLLLSVEFGLCGHFLGAAGHLLQGRKDKQGETAPQLLFRKKSCDFVPALWVWVFPHRPPLLGLPLLGLPLVGLPLLHLLQLLQLELPVGTSLEGFLLGSLFLCPSFFPVCQPFEPALAHPGFLVGHVLPVCGAASAFCMSQTLRFLQASAHPQFPAITLFPPTPTLPIFRLLLLP